MARIKKPQQRAARYERDQARRRGGKPLGGSGRPDYIRPPILGEVKNWKRPVHSGVVTKANIQGVKEIVSSSGFSQPAIALAKAQGITLIYRGRRLT
ncbi:MAG: hypothetical protein HYY03_06075 [Chloroflexi bacterium]|nr:hypothetical protein [Chloroflexota bacterium]